MKAARPPRRGGIRYVPDQHTGAGRCRGCAGRIVWALTDAGKRMPVDAQAVLTGGNLVLWHDDVPDADTMVSSLSAYQARTGAVYTGQLWISHYATCPELDRPPPQPEAPPSRQLNLLTGGKK